MDIPIHSIREGVVLHALPDDGKATARICTSIASEA